MGNANTAHELILQAIGKGYRQNGLIHRLDFPTQPFIGSYKPDFLWFTMSPIERLALIGEVESSDYASKDIPGACLLADNLSERYPAIRRPLLAFVVPDGISIGDLGHVEERLNIAASRMERITIMPARRVSDFLAWFQQHCIATEQALLAKETAPEEHF